MPAQTQSITPWYLDKALWSIILTPIFAFVGNKFGLDLNTETLLGLILPVIAYIIAHKWKSGKVLVAEIEAENRKIVEAAPPTKTATEALEVFTK